MKAWTSALAAATICLAGCSNDDDGGTGGDGAGASGTVLALEVVDGPAIDAESLGCLFRQAFGASNQLTLQLQYLASPNEVAFALYIDDPVPSEPYAVAAGQQGGFAFEAFSADGAYGDLLVDGEIELRLASLPSPADLVDGDVVPLRGSLVIDRFTLPEAASGADTPGPGLTLAAGTVDVDCDAVYQLSQVVNGG